MKIAYLSSEATPFIKIGGLADVAGELPRALTDLGQDIRVFLPNYPGMQLHAGNPERALSVRVPHDQGEITIAALETEWAGVRFYLLDFEHEGLAGPVYGDPIIDAEKFTIFSLGALKVCEALDWSPDICHANDWHTAPAMIWLADHRSHVRFWNSTASVFSIHNLPYMGAGMEEILKAFDLSIVEDPRLPEWARHMPLPAALSVADWLITVSPSYAREIQTPAFGFGLEQILRARSERLVGILNGIEPSIWDPAIDSALPATFSPERLEQRAEVKRALLDQLKLAPEEGVPVLCMITRLDYQKGVDIAIEALQSMLDQAWYFVLLGAGTEEIEEQVRSFADRFPERVRTLLRFDAALARRLYGGADMILMPSRYEPCGLAQMIAMRYGCVPLVRKTGGLKDTVFPYAPDGGTGFLFEEPEPEAMVAALTEALNLYRKSDSWKPLQLRGMRQDHSWNTSAVRYLDVYEQALQERTP